MADNPGVVIPKCPICGFTSEGNHYGIQCCRSCASFFKRAVEKGEQFERHVVGQPFDYCNLLENRNACKQCRFLKCIEAGMQISAVQPKREPSGPQGSRKRRPVVPQPDPQDHVMQGAKKGFLQQPQSTFSDFCRSYPETQEVERNLPEITPENIQGSSGSIRPISDVDAARQLILASNRPLFDFPEPERVLAEAVVRLRQPPSPEIEDPLSVEVAAIVLSDSEVDEYEQEGNDDYREEERRRRKKRKDKEIYCAVCPGGKCKDGYAFFKDITRAFIDHTRQMQLSFTTLDRYIDEMANGITMRKMEAKDISRLSSVELTGLVFWTEKMGHFDQMNSADQLNLLMRYSVRKLSLDHFYSASKYTEQAKERNFVMNNYTYVPKDKTGFETPAEDDRQQTAKFNIFKHTFDRFWDNIIDRFIAMEIRQEEIVFLHLLILWSPLNKQFVSDEAKPLLDSRRNWAIQMISEFFRLSEMPDAEIRLGELFNLFQEIEVLVSETMTYRRALPLYC